MFPLDTSQSYLTLLICPFCPTLLMLSTKPHYFLSWQWVLCEPRMKRDPRSLPFWCCLASAMTCIIRSAGDMHSFCSRSFFLPHLFRFRIIIVYKKFLLSSNEQISSAPSFDSHHTNQSCIVLAVSSQLAFSCSDRLFHTTTVGPFFCSQSRSPLPADWKKGGANRYFSLNSRDTIDLLQCS